VAGKDAWHPYDGARQEARGARPWQRHPGRRRAHVGGSRVRAALVSPTWCACAVYSIPLQTITKSGRESFGVSTPTAINCPSATGCPTWSALPLACASSSTAPAAMSWCPPMGLWQPLSCQSVGCVPARRHTAVSTAVHGNAHDCSSLTVSQELLMHSPPRQACAGTRGGRRARRPREVSGIWFAHEPVSIGVLPLAHRPHQRQDI
jgi:hypothetical protein